jgi:hypothetical protein
VRSALTAPAASKPLALSQEVAHLLSVLVGRHVTCSGPVLQGTSAGTTVTNRPDFFFRTVQILSSYTV